MKSTRYTQVPLTRHPSPAWTATLAATTALAAALAGCRPPAVTFPARPIASTEARRDYDTDGDGKADFFLLAEKTGRFDRIAYDRDGDGKPDHIIHLDAKVWAIIDAEEAPTDYEDLRAEEPADGMYIDPNGSPLFLVGGVVVTSADAVVESLGEKARDLLADVGEATVVLERLGKVY